MNTDNIDKFGHCVLCHRNLIYKRVVDGRQEDMFVPTHGHTTFLLNTGSQMQVCMCKPCQQNNDLADVSIHNNIMEAVQKGWELEAKLLVENNVWSTQKSVEYLNYMKSRTIDCHVEHLANNVIQNRIKELTNVNHSHS